MQSFILVCLVVLSSCGITKGIKGFNMHAEAGNVFRDSVNTSLLACEWPEEYPGSDDPGAAYKEGQAAAEDADCHEDQQEVSYLTGYYEGLLLAGSYERGSEEWDERNQEWLDSEEDEPYPDDLRDVDGDGYQDSVDVASDPELYT